MTGNMTGKTKIQIYFDDDVVQAIKHEAVDARMSFSAYVRGLVAEARTNHDPTLGRNHYHLLAAQEAALLELAEYRGISFNEMVSRALDAYLVGAIRAARSEQALGNTPDPDPEPSQ